MKNKISVKIFYHLLLPFILRIFANIITKRKQYLFTGDCVLSMLVWFF